MDASKTPTEVTELREGFIAHPKNMNDRNRRYWNNFHILPAVKDLMVELRAYNEVACWALGKKLGSVEDLPVKGMAILMAMTPNRLWDKTMGIAKGGSAPRLKVMTCGGCCRCPQATVLTGYGRFTLLSHGLASDLYRHRHLWGSYQSKSDIVAIGTAAFSMNLSDHSLDLTWSEGDIATLLIRRLFEWPPEGNPGGHHSYTTPNCLCHPGQE